MKFRHLLLVVLSCYTVHLLGQDRFQAVLGSAHFETLTNSLSAGNEFIHTGYGIGYVNSSEDALIFRTDSMGFPLWVKSFGGSADDRAHVILPEPDGFVVAGRTYSFGAGDRDYFFAKIDEDGNFQSFKTYGGPYDDRFNSMIALQDGGYVMTGGTYSGILGSCDVPIIKINKDGDVVWSRVYGGYNFEIAYAIAEDPEGAIVTAAYSNSFTQNGIEDIYLIKTDALGNTLWAKTFGGTGIDRITSHKALDIDDSGNIYVAVYSFSFGFGERDWYVLKVSPQGDLIWAYAYGGNLTDTPYNVMINSEGNVMIAGHTSSAESENKDAWAMLVDPNGSILWSRVFGGDGEDWFSQLQESSSNYYTGFGSSSSFGAGLDDIFITRFETISQESCYGYEYIPNAQSAPTTVLNANQSRSFSLLEISQIPTDQIQVHDEEFDYELVCLDTGALNFNDNFSSPDGFKLFPNSPNPFNPTTQIKFTLSKAERVKIQIYDALGRKVRDLVLEQYPAGEHIVEWDGINNEGQLCTSGLYYCQINAGNFQTGRKMTLLK